MSEAANAEFGITDNLSVTETAVIRPANQFELKQAIPASPDQVKLQKLFRNIKQDPTLLDSCPGSIGDAPLATKQKLFDSEWSAIPIDGMDGRRVNLVDIDAVADLPLRTKELLRYGSPAWCRVGSLLEAVRFTEDEQSFSAEVLLKAREFLGTYYPDWLPAEPTRVMPIYPETDGDLNFYLGKINGSHYIGVTVENPGEHRFYVFEPNPYRESDFDMEAQALNLVHELFHQKNAELAGESGTPKFLADIQNRLKEVDTSVLPAREVVKEAVNAGPIDDPMKSLADSLDEGIAHQGTLSIFDLLIEKAKGAGDLDRVQKLIKAKEMHLSLIRYRKQPNSDDLPTDETTRIYQEGTLGLMRSLGLRYGFDKLPELVKEIDWAGCRKIPLDSLEYKQVLADPNLIPGISGGLVSSSN